MYEPLPECLTIKESLIHGLGLFATKNIPKDTNFGFSHFEDSMRIIRTPLGGFYNHSDNPNCIKWGPEQYDENMACYSLKTLKDIKVGEEITVEYTFYKP